MPSKIETHSSSCVLKAIYSCYRKQDFNFHLTLIKQSILGLHLYFLCQGSTAKKVEVAILGPTKLPVIEDVSP